MEKIIAVLKKWGPFILIALVLVLISFIIGKRSTKPERDLQLSNLIACRDSVKTYKIIVNDLQNTVTEQGAIILSKNEAIKVGILEQERLRKLHIKEVVTNAELSGYIHVLRDSLQMQPGTTIITVKDTAGISNSYVKIPFKLLDVAEKNLSLTAGMYPNKSVWFDLSVPVSGTVTIGYKRDGLFKSKPIGVFTTENPYLNINHLDLLIVKEKQRFYNKTWFHVVVGAVAMESFNLLVLKR
jgi:hypothetical protein